MSFRPINDDHAVQSVAFTLQFEQPFGPETINFVQSEHKRWSAELPAVNRPVGIGIEFGAEGGSPKQVPLHGITFSYLRPDGTPAWQLRFEPQSVVVECTRYTRWERIWSIARRHLEAATAAVTEVGREQPRPIVSMSLQFVDMFETAEASYDLRDLFTENPYLSPMAFTSGELWHSHVGWFDRSDKLGLSLNNLNVDARQTEARGQVMNAVTILHVQQLRFASPLQAPENGSGFWNSLETSMQRLHILNKQVLAAMLNPEMTSKISLIQTQERIQNG